MSSKHGKLTSDLLAEDHAALGFLIKEFISALDRNDYDSGYRRLDLVWARLAMHIRAENHCLFPAILNAWPNYERDAGQMAYDIDPVIARLRDDHDFFMRELGSAIKTMRKLRIAHDTEDATNHLHALRQKVMAFSLRLDIHNKLEEEQVYQWPTSFLTPSGEDHLSACVRREIGNLPPRFTIEKV